MLNVICKDISKDTKGEILKTSILRQTAKLQV